MLKSGLRNLCLVALSILLVPVFAQTSTTTVLTSNLNPSGFGQTVTFTATVTGSNPTGTIAFRDGAQTIGTVALAGNVATFSTSQLSVGNHTNINARYSGDAANKNSSSPGYLQTVNAAPTAATTLSSAPNPSNAGQNVTLTATVAGNNPTGNITFKDGATDLGTVGLVGGSASLVTNQLAVGSHSLTAVYGGDANNPASTSAVRTQSVTGLATSTALSSSPNPSNPGQTVTLSATVTGNGPTGNVTFQEGTTVLGTAALVGGVASFATSQLAAGTHSIIASYAGDAVNASSTGAAYTQTVNAGSSSTTVTSSLNPAPKGQIVVFTATVIGSSPTGNVTFKDGATILSTRSLTSGAASYSTSALLAGDHNVTVEYAGNATNSPSTSAILVQTITPPATSATVVSSKNPSVYGDTVTLTATVAGNNASGTVTFKDGAATLGTASLVAGGKGSTASLGVGPISVGTHSLTVVYAGDANNAGGTSSALSQVVNRANTSTSMTASPSTATYGQTVALSATVAGQGPTGAVTFTDSGVAIGTANVSASGIATLNISTLAVSGHSIRAEYAGDANLNSSNSPLTTLTVNKAATSTTMTSSANPSTYGDNVTLLATVTGQSPTGTVNVKNASNNVVGSASLSGGIATIVVSGLNVSTYLWTAQYTGDSNNSSSTSAEISQVVGKANTTTTVSSSANPIGAGQPVTFTAVVLGQSLGGGAITFKDGATALGTGNAAGGTGNTKTATFTTSALAVGNHGITAQFDGDGKNNASVSTPITQGIGSSSTTTTLASSPSPSTYPDAVTLTASVNGFAPTGMVTFKDGTNSLGTAALSGSGDTRTAVLSVPALSGGSHTLGAVYSGDALNPGSTSAAFTHTVNKRATTTTLSISSNSSVYGQTVTWTATITGGAGLTGAMNFMDGTATLGSAAVSAGVATFNSALTGAGAHSITAVYGGDGNYTGSTSTAVPLTVSKLASSLALSTSPNPSAAGQAITLTATITGMNAAGLVTFKNGAATLGTITAVAGVAKGSFANFGVGNPTFSADYAGDANHLPSSSSASQTVTKANATTTLSVTPSPASSGQNVTLIARINGYSASGTVTFSEGAATLGTAPVSGGAATWSLSSLTTGTHTLSASYSGDANNFGGNSNAASLLVNARTGFTWQYGYDAMGRLNTVVDPNVLATYIYYDKLGRPIQTQQPPNTGSTVPTVIQMGYNLDDSLTSIVDPRVLTTTYTVTGLGTTKNQISPDTGTTSYTYDANGNALTSIDARGKQTTYDYDTLDRIKTISYPTGPGTSFEYDGGAAPSQIEKGMLTRMTDESGQSAYTHDGLGRLTTKTVTIGAKTFAVRYGWGDAGSALDKLTSVTYPSGSRVNYGYDDKGYVNAISVTPVNANGSGLSGTTTPLLGNVTYNADNNPTGWTWSDSKARTIGYDAVGQVTSYSLGDPQGAGAGAGALRTVSRDNAGRIGGYTHTGNGAANLDQTFGYDNLNRLMNQTVNGSSTSYSYDETGNRTSKTIGGTSYTNTVATTSNKYTQTQDVGGTASVLYDAAGHITNDGTNTYTYNDRGRMTSATTPGGVVSYLYNGLNQRAAKSGPTAAVPTGTVYFVYDENGQLLGEYDASGAPNYETLYLGSSPVGVMKQAGTAGGGNIAVSLYNVHADQIDSPRVITKQDNTIVWRWDTAEAFGATAPNQDPSALGIFAFNQRFPGQVFDSETGLFQNWNREYNARTGRYVESDPIGLEGGINTYAYVENNPLLFIDPLGLQTASQDPWFGYGKDQGFKDWWHKMKPYYGGQDIPNKGVCDNLYKDYEDDKSRGKGGKSGKGGQKKGDKRPNVNELMRGRGWYGRGGSEE